MLADAETSVSPPGSKVPCALVGGLFGHAGPHRDDHQVSDASNRDQHTWRTPTGEPCPRSVHLDGQVEGSGDCHGCGMCLLLAGLVDQDALPREPL